MTRVATILICSAFLLAGCEKSLEAQYRSVVNFFKGSQIGPSQDYILEKDGYGMQNEPVAVVFGFVDDYEVCMKMAGVMNSGSPGAYRCRPAN